MKPLCITSKPEDLDQGLFGMVFLYVFQVLPYLHAHNLYPAWQIRTAHYGDPPDFITIPGALDLAYTPPTGPFRTIELHELRRRHAQVLGNDWTALSRIWHAYFKIPQRVLSTADQVLPAGKRIVGIHYRGTDKQTATWDSNPISQDQYLTLIHDFLSARSDFDIIFAATDEFSFIDRLRASTQLPVIALGEVEFHLSAHHTTTRAEKTDRALLDCVLLSRCHAVIETSSGLPSFARLFQPSLEIYRTAASKLFSDMPYFPVAYIPVLPTTSPASADILRRTMESDWTSVPKADVFKKPFTAKPRWPTNHRAFEAAEKLGAADLLAKVFNGYR